MPRCRTYMRAARRLRCEPRRILAAVLANSGSAEIERTYGYSDGATTTRPTAHPGVGVVFHSGGKGFLLFEQAARAGQGKGSRAFDLQDAF
ncbi:putative protein OS=Streptomyces rimosus subsp. rimosus (strain ATCC / DSM 40260 / JCM 4667 / NRRL 2234) OX=1265868 GN=SRIM_017470 PE=4 SV=1 [Streptomyces rimosus subsp. rimosus]